MSPGLGPEVGPYRVVRRLGSGGMGTVLLAEDTRLRRPVALKTLSDPDAVSPRARQRLLREARAAAALSHPNIAAVHDVLDVEGQVVIVFEYVEGETLAEALTRGPWPVGRAVELAIELADALDAAHTHGIVHRDLKPANIALSTQGHAVVLDFGIARFVPHADAETTFSEPATTAGGLVGTPGYAAPEQWLGQPADARADLYALGAILFELLTGHPPFVAKDAAALGRMAVTEDAPAVGDLVRAPAALDELVQAMLARDPARRPASASAVRAALRDIRMALGSGDGVAAVPRRLPGRWPRRLALAGVLATAAVVPFYLLARPETPSGGDGRAPVVAVLPVALGAGDAPGDYLASGIAESLITRLAASPAMTVLSRAAVADVRAGQPDLRRLMRDLDAAYLVETGVQQSGEQLRVTLRLVRGDATVAWAETFDGTFDGIFDLQTRISAAVGEALQLHLPDEGGAGVDVPPTRSAAALAAYWRGRALLERRDVAGHLERATAAFMEAVDLDLTFADAHAALGEAYWARYQETRDPVWAARAAEAGQTALRLAPSSPAVRYTVAITLASSGQLAAATEELQRVLAARPNFEDARLHLGRVLARQGRIDEAIVEFQRAVDLRPNYAGSYTAMGLSLFEAGRYREAATAFERATALQPDNAVSHQQTGVAFQALGDVDRASEHYRHALAIRPYAPAYSNLGTIHYDRGEYAEAAENYRRAIALRPQARETHRNLGDALSRLGRDADARASYAEAVRLAEADLQVNPRDARIVASLAVYLQKAGRAGEAARRAGEALALGGSDFEVWRRAAQVHALAGRLDEGVRALERALTLGLSPGTVRRDDDLAPLGQHAEFETLLRTTTAR